MKILLLDVEVFWFKKNIVHHYINLSFSIVFADGESRHISRFNKKLTEFLKETYEYVSLSEIEFNEENATIFSLSLGDYDPYRNIQRETILIPVATTVEVF